MSAKIKIEYANDAIEILENTWNEYQPEQPFEYSFLDDNLNNLYKAEAQTIKIVSLFSIVSIIISCIGLLGLIMLCQKVKPKKSGSRKVNGASIRNVLSLLSTELIINTSIAMAIAVPIGWYAVNLWRANFAYKTTISWWIFVFSGSDGFSFNIIIRKLSYNQSCTKKSYRSFTIRIVSYKMIPA